MQAQPTSDSIQQPDAGTAEKKYQAKAPQTEVSVKKPLKLRTVQSCDGWAWPDSSSIAAAQLS
jgi:hypothetical protein